MTAVVSVPPFYVTREECAKILGYASSGLRKFIAEHPDFPIGVRRDPNAKNAPVVYKYTDVMQWCEEYHKRLIEAAREAAQPKPGESLYDEDDEIITIDEDKD